MMRKILSIVCLIICFYAASVIAADRTPTTISFIVITHPSVPKNDITAINLAKAYFGSQLTWSNGKVIKPIHQPDSQLRTLFMGVIQRLSPMSVRNYWLQRVFSGQIWGVPELEGEAAIVKYCESTPGAVGYLSRYTEQDLRHVTYFVFTVVR